MRLTPGIGLRDEPVRKETLIGPIIGAPRVHVVIGKIAIGTAIDIEAEIEARISGSIRIGGKSIEITLIAEIAMIETGAMAIGREMMMIGGKIGTIGGEMATTDGEVATIGAEMTMIGGEATTTEEMMIGGVAGETTDGLTAVSGTKMRANVATDRAMRGPILAGLLVDGITTTGGITAIDRAEAEERPLELTL